MKTFPSRLHAWQRCGTLLAFFAATALAPAQIVTNWVAYNDHRAGPTPPTPGQWGTALGVTTYDMGYVAGGGNLTNFLDGTQLPVTMTVTPNGTPDDFGAAEPPNPGTPAYDLFFGICDLDIDGIVGVRYSADTYVTFTFDNLDPDKRFLFRGTSCRGGDYLLRWSVATIVGVDGAIDNHTSGVLTSNNFPAALEAGQAAWNSGENRVGDVVGWDFINPGPDGSFSIICSNYIGPVSATQNADATRYGYSFAAMLLAEVEASAAVITMHPPAETTVVQNRPFSLRVAATGTPLLYQWYKEGSGAIDGATFPTYSVAQADLDDSGDYYVVVLNPVANATSTVAHVTVDRDEVAPALAAVFAYPAVDPATQIATLNQITIEYDEPVELLSATATANYLLSTGGNPVSVTLTNPQTVVLDLASPLAEDTDYSVTISGVSDILNNTIDSILAPFHTWVSGAGNGLLFEAFDTGAGVETAVLTNSPVFPDQPFLRTNLWIFDSRAVYPDDAQENYGSRIRGVFIPPISGDWVFFLRTFDRGEVRFNPTGLDAAGAIPILAEVTGNNPRDWDKFISVPFPLRGGQAYYIEGLQKADVGTDVIKVAARLAGTGLPPLGVLDTDIDPSALQGGAIGTPLAPRDLGGPLTIAEDLPDTEAEDYHPVTLSLSLDNPSGLPVIYRWYRDDAVIDGATGPTYTFQAALADEGATFRVEMAKLGSSAASRTATLTVRQDDTPPMVEEIISPAADLTTFQVVFNEMMQALDVEDPFNYFIGVDSAMSATLGPDLRTVTVVWGSPLTLGEFYDLEVLGGSDLAGNQLEPVIVTFLAGNDVPQLAIQVDGNLAVLSWPASFTGFVLEEAAALADLPANTSWSPVGTPPVVVDGRNTVTVLIEGSLRVFRLSQ